MSLRSVSFICIVCLVSVCLFAQGGSLSPTKMAGHPIKLPDGLEYWDLNPGTGQAATTGSLVTVQYTGWLKDGLKFDSSYDRGKPFQFKVGAGQVIKGWDEGILGMKVGGKRQLRIPAKLGYGKAGVGALVPPNATLIFEVELLRVQAGNE